VNLLVDKSVARLLKICSLNRAFRYMGTQLYDGKFFKFILKTFSITVTLKMNFF
jgi:hypothetical protein